jgi:hypothetical protein
MNTAKIFFYKQGTLSFHLEEAAGVWRQVNAGYHHVKGVCKSFTIKHQGQ